MYWVNDIDAHNSNVGSLHSPKYANIVKFIIENNYFPYIGVHSVQAIITWFLSLIGPDSFHLHLHSIHYLAKVFIFVQISNFKTYGVIKRCSVLVHSMSVYAKKNTLPDMTYVKFGQQCTKRFVETILKSY